MPDQESTSQPATLKRSLGLLMLTFYGLGTIVGGGFYALAGKVSVQAGMLTPVAFLVASLIAMFSAFSYAELSARYPFSAGEAHYVLAAFRKVWPSATVGWAVIATGVVSAATLAVAFAGFVRSLVDLPEWLVVCAMVIGLGLVAAWGIGQSAILALIIKVIELSGLLAVVFAGSDTLPTITDRWRELMPTFSFNAWSGILLGAYLAFYSFVVCATVNLSLIVVRVREQRPTVGPIYPLWLPVTCLLTSVAFLVFHAVALIVRNQ